MIEQTSTGYRVWLNDAGDTVPRSAATRVKLIRNDGRVQFYTLIPSTPKLLRTPPRVLPTK